MSEATTKRASEVEPGDFFQTVVTKYGHDLAIYVEVLEVHCWLGFSRACPAPSVEIHLEDGRTMKLPASARVEVKTYA